MSGSSNLNSFHDRRQVAVQLVSCGVLPPGLVQDCSQHSCVQLGDTVYVTHRFDSTINVSHCYFYGFCSIHTQWRATRVNRTIRCVKRLKSTFLVILGVVSLKRTIWRMYRELFHQLLLYCFFDQAVTSQKRCLRQDSVS